MRQVFRFAVGCDVDGGDTEFVAQIYGVSAARVVAPGCAQDFAFGRRLKIARTSHM